MKRTISTSFPDNLSSKEL